MAFGATSLQKQTLPKIRVRQKVEGPSFAKSMSARMRKRNVGGIPRNTMKGLAPTNLMGGIR